MPAPKPGASKKASSSRAVSISNRASGCALSRAKRPPLPTPTTSAWTALQAAAAPTARLHRRGRPAPSRRCLSAAGRRRRCMPRTIHHRRRSTTPPRSRCWNASRPWGRRRPARQGSHGEHRRHLGSRAGGPLRWPHGGRRTTAGAHFDFRHHGRKGRARQGSSGGGGRFDYAYFTDAVLQDYAKRAVHQGQRQSRRQAGPAGEMTGGAGPRLARHPAARSGRPRPGGRFNRKAVQPSPGASASAWAAKGVTVVDDGTIADRRGSLTIDDEGNRRSARY